ncbi:siderophore-interacting protein [Labrenzia sp. PHM005]|uniref:siderophore-interacting protein n=1 Tax=Labrenzia sp. PHM005 TaxID=2590016 RepID=UPI0011401CD9|nr:siderophore-interacting protein [Labrenzia sp. PHM005]QDG74982.1 siderophore-interacting protein [Labrenzia sp. PHM005]
MTCKSSAYVTLNQAEGVFARLLDHAREHDVVLEQTGPKDFKIVVGSGFIAIGTDGLGLILNVSAESVSILYFLKEAAALHLAEYNAEVAEALHWEDESTRPLNLKAPPSFHELSVVSVSEPMDGLIRLRLSGTDDLSGLAGPGIHVKLMLPINPERTPVWPQASRNGLTKWPKGADELHVRYYTIKFIDLTAGVLDIDIVRHDGGLIADWAVAAKPGAKIGLLGPGGGETPDKAKRVLLCGDKTALPALARMLEELPDNVAGDVVAEAADLDCLTHYLPSTHLTLHVLPEDRFRSDVEQYSESLTVNKKPDFAWFAGEHQNAQSMRRFFKSDLGLSKGQQYAITYWRDGGPLEAN